MDLSVSKPRSPRKTLLLLAIASVACGPVQAWAQGCIYHAEPNRGDWVECPPGGGGGRVTPMPRNEWGAIAISPSTLVSGDGHGFSNRAAAERRAMAECAAGGHHDCKLVIWVQNNCMAIATGDNHAYGAAGGRTRATAQQSAIEWCRKGAGGDCAISYAWCP